jgi:hypothetical protein
MSEEFDHQICPSCKGEFTLAVTRCAECDVDLVAPGADPEDFPPASELILVRVAPEPWIEALSEALSGREAPHRVEPLSAEEAPEAAARFGTSPLFGIYVRAAEEAVAREFDAAIAAQVDPQIQAEPLSDGESEPCPACGAEVPAEVSECPDCGLTFGV